MEKIELIHEAIHRLVDDERGKSHGKEEGGGIEEEEEEEEETILYSRSLSQLNSIGKDVDTNNHRKCLLEKEKQPSPLPTECKDCGGKDEETNEIVKELKTVKRQNRITHCLLSILIVVTAVWQFNEASLLLSLKEKITNPIKTLGDVITGSFKGKGKKAAIEAPPLHPISVPELPHLDLPHLHLNGHEE